MKKEFKEFFDRNKLLVGLFLLTIVLRIPSLFEPYWYGDEGVYLAVGMAVRKGVVLYRDIFDNKTPLIYWLSALVNGRLFGLKLLALAANLGLIYYFFRLLEYYAPKLKTILKTLLLVILVILTTVPKIEGNIANAENFFIFFIVAGYYYGLIRQKPYLSGLLFSLGFLTKVPVVFDLGALIIFLFFFDKQTKYIINISPRGLKIIVSFLVPICLTFVFFFLMGAAKEYLQAAYIQTVGYVSSWQSGSHSFNPISLIKGEMGLKILIVFAVTVGLYFSKKRWDKKLILLTLWCIYALFGTTLSGRPYPHYLLQLVVPFGLLTGQLFNLSRKQIIVPALTGLLLLVALFHYQYWGYSTISYYQNFLNLVTGRSDRNQYQNYFNPNLSNIYRTAEIINSYSGEDDRVFIWGDYPYLYPLSRRLPATKYVVAYHIIDLRGETANQSALEAKPPALIVVDNNTTSLPVGLDLLIKRQYRLIETSGNFALYALRGYFANIFTQ